MRRRRWIKGCGRRAAIFLAAALAVSACGGCMGSRDGGTAGNDVSGNGAAVSGESGAVGSGAAAGGESSVSGNGAAIGGESDAAGNGAAGIGETEREEGYPREAVEFVAPAGAGSGFDVTARVVSQCLENGNLTPVPLPVTNRPGGGGRVALEYLNEAKGRDNVLSVFSPPICLIHLNGDTELNYKDNTTPIAMLLVDYGCFAVKADSPWQSLPEVMDALKEDPASLTVGGTSVENSLDHIQFLKVAHAAGVERLGEIPYEGFENGNAAAQLMGGRVDLLSSGISDVVGLMESGDVRILAVTSKERLEGETISRVPSCAELGIDAEFSTWRGIFGPGNMPEYARDYWEEALRSMAGSAEWRQICRKYGWTMDFRGHEEFAQFLDEVNREYGELLLEIRK